MSLKRFEIMVNIYLIVSYQDGHDVNENLEFTGSNYHIFGFNLSLCTRIRIYKLNI